VNQDESKGTSVAPTWLLQISTTCLTKAYPLPGL
jgi:hypothetical protein